MVSSKDQAKKIFKQIRRFSRELLEHLCAETHEEKDSIFLSLDKVMKQFWPIVRAVMEEQGTLWQLRGKDATDLEDRLGSKLFQQLYHDALDVAFDVKFGHMPVFEKGKPGRKQNVELAKRIWALREGGKTSKKILNSLKADGVNLSLEGVEAYLKTRRRSRGL